MRTLTKCLAVMLVLVTAPTRAQGPIEHARLDRRPAPAGLAASLARDAVDGWVGWTAPAKDDRAMCCWSAWDRGRKDTGGSCRLDRSETNISSGDGASALAGPEMRLLVQLSAGRPRAVRMYSAGCRVEARATPITWFESVAAADSVAALESWAGTTAGDDAVTAIALHVHPAADSALDRLFASGPGQSRERAAFWLGAARGRHGFEALRDRLDVEPDADVREQIVVGLAQNEDPGVAELLLRTARAHRSADTRGHALFWIAQSAGERAAEAIGHAVEHDPDEDVKDKAVFALSQLPKDQGVPLLLRTMRTNRNPEIRKRAAFWLGQSKDPRALAYFEQLLGSAPAREP